MEITIICGGHYILYSFRNGTLDLLMADSPILDYYRATDPGCDLQRIGETYVEDAYAIGMTKGYVMYGELTRVIGTHPFMCLTLFAQICPRCVLFGKLLQTAITMDNVSFTITHHFYSTP